MPPQFRLCYAPPMTRTAIVLSSAAGILLLGGGGALWAQYGGQIFFDMLAAGLAGCFY